MKVIYDRKAAMRNTIVYAVALVLAIGGLIAWIASRSVAGIIIGGVVAVWAIGGLKANVRAIRTGFTNLD
jgi:hypothetical protein